MIDTKIYDITTKARSTLRFMILPPRHDRH